MRKILYKTNKLLPQDTGYRVAVLFFVAAGVAVLPVTIYRLTTGKAELDWLLLVAMACIACGAGAGQASATEETIQSYKRNGRAWCMDQLILTTDSTKKTHLRSAVQQIDRESGNAQ